jgi:hypothetical protein
LRPLTHFLRIVRAIELKGAGIVTVMGIVSMWRYRQTLD